MSKSAQKNPLEALTDAVIGKAMNKAIDKHDAERKDERDAAAIDKAIASAAAGTFGKKTPAEIEAINARAREIVAQQPEPSANRDAAALPSRKEYLIDPRLIDIVEGHNVRWQFDVEPLADLIEDQYAKDEIGVRVAVEVQRSADKPGRFNLVSGERRLRAVRFLMEKRGASFVKGIPAKLVDKGADAMELFIRDMQSNSGKPLEPLEEAYAYGRMKDQYKMTTEKIARAVGRSHLHVHTMLHLLTADQSVLDAVKSGEMGVTMAREIALKAKGDSDMQKEMVRDLKAAGKDKKKKAAAAKVIKGKIRASQEKRATKAGRVLKMRALSDDQLGALGAKVAAYLKELLADCKMSAGDADGFLGVIALDNQLAAAYTLGALHGLRAAAGEKINLKL